MCVLLCCGVVPCTLRNWYLLHSIRRQVTMLFRKFFVQQHYHYHHRRGLCNNNHAITTITSCVGRRRTCQIVPAVLTRTTIFPKLCHSIIRIQWNRINACGSPFHEPISSNKFLSTTTTISEREIQRICQTLDQLYYETTERTKELFHSILITDEHGGRYIDRERLQSNDNDLHCSRSDHPSNNSSQLAKEAQDAYQLLEREYNTTIQETLRNHNNMIDLIVRQYGMKVHQCHVELQMVLYTETHDDTLNNNTIEPNHS